MGDPKASFGLVAGLCRWHSVAGGLRGDTDTGVHSLESALVTPGTGWKLASATDGGWGEPNTTVIFRTSHPQRRNNSSPSIPHHAVCPRCSHLRSVDPGGRQPSP